MAIKFEIGDRVYCSETDQQGVVVEPKDGQGVSVYEREVYPLVVEMPHSFEAYTPDGRYTEDGPVTLTLIGKPLTWREYRGWHVATLGDSCRVRIGVSADVLRPGLFWIECKAVGILPQAVEADTLDQAKRAALEAVSARLTDILNIINI